MDLIHVIMYMYVYDLFPLCITGELPNVRESKLADKNSILVSNSLMAYGYIKGRASLLS